MGTLRNSSSCVEIPDKTPIISPNPKKRAHPIFGYTKRCNVAALKKALDNGADPNVTDQRGWVPLIHAVRVATPEIAALLIDAKANLEYESKSGMTAMSHAAVSGKAKILELLVKRNANIEARDNDGRTPLSLLAKNKVIK